MNNENEKAEYAQNVRNVAYLCACALANKIPDKDRLSRMDLNALYKAASRHLLTAITAFALESAGIRDHAFSQAKAKAIRKVGLMDAEMLVLFDHLEQAGIWYMPLKGTVLKDDYPEFGMRQMSDHDILFDAGYAEKVREIMEGMGYTTDHYEIGVHDTYHKEPVCNFEMHRALFGVGHDERLSRYYSTVKDRLLPDEGKKYGRHFSPEDFYIYLLAHEYKHYSNGGTGLRSLLDTYVFLTAKENESDISATKAVSEGMPDGKYPGKVIKREETLDWDYIKGELEKLGITEFERRNRSLAMHLFGSGELTSEDEEMLHYVIFSGTYGTVVHHVENVMKKKGYGKARYALHRFLVPVRKNTREYEYYAKAYPQFYGNKLLLPFLPFYRTFMAIKRGTFLKELRALRRAKVDKRLKK